MICCILARWQWPLGAGSLGLKLSGMRWGTRGAQAIPTMRGWDQSDRFDAPWALVAATYHTEVQVLANVVDLTPKPAPKKRRP